MVYLLNYITKMSLVKEGNFFVLENTGEEIKLKIVTICFFYSTYPWWPFPKEEYQKTSYKIIYNARMNKLIDTKK